MFQCHLQVLRLAHLNQTGPCIHSTYSVLYIDTPTFVPDYICLDSLLTASKAALLCSHA